MANGASPQTTFAEYKRLTPAERELFTFTQLCKIDTLCDQFDALNSSYAAKWVETVMKWLGGITIGSVAVAIVSLVIRSPQN